MGGKMLVPLIFQKAVPAIYHVDQEGKPKPVGTGFFLSYSHPTDPQREVSLLVTARHLIFTKSGQRIPDVLMRANLVGGGSVIVPLDGSAFAPMDPSLDFAVLAGTYPDAPIDMIHIGAETLMATQEELTSPPFGVGAELFFVGLFIPIEGHQRIQPITRYGRISLIPEDPVYWNEEEGYIRVMLAEMMVFPGNSGAPVFVDLGHTNSKGERYPRLFGVVKGTFTQEHAGVVGDKGDEYEFRVKNTAGIAGVVPALFLDRFIRQTVIPVVAKLT
jgi:hypothetical protein